MPRGSRPYLRERRGEVPLRHSPINVFIEYIYGTVEKRVVKIAKISLNRLQKNPEETSEFSEDLSGDIDG